MVRNFAESCTSEYCRISKKPADFAELRTSEYCGISQNSAEFWRNSAEFGVRCGLCLELCNCKSRCRLRRSARFPDSGEQLRHGQLLAIRWSSLSTVVSRAPHCGSTAHRCRVGAYRLSVTSQWCYYSQTPNWAKLLSVPESPSHGLYATAAAQV